MDPRDEKPGKYEVECGLARQIARAEPDSDEAVLAFAEAVTSSNAHWADVDDGVLDIRYLNGFGPTCTVDDVIERMTVAGWRRVCTEALRRMLKRIHALQDVSPSSAIRHWPTVTLVPERDSPVVAEVRLQVPVSRRARAFFNGGRRRG